MTDGAEQRLAGELADSSNYGIAKSFFMAGERAGFDMTTEQGLQAWTASYNARLLALDTKRALAIQPQARLPASAERRLKKVKRKQVRQSRRKNR